MPRGQVANKLHEGRARARRAAMPVYRPSTSHTATGEGSLMLATLLCIHLVFRQEKPFEVLLISLHIVMFLCEPASNSLGLWQAESPELQFSNLWLTLATV